MPSILREVLTAHELQDLGLSSASFNVDFLTTRSGLTLEQFIKVRLSLVLKCFLSLASLIILQVICTRPDDYFIAQETGDMWLLQGSAEGLVEFSSTNAGNIRMIWAVLWIGLVGVAITSLDIFTSIRLSPRNLASRDWWKVEAYWTTFVDHVNNLLSVMFLNTLWREGRMICFTVDVALMMLYSWIPRTVLLLRLLLASFDPNSKVHSTRTGLTSLVLGVVGQVKVLGTKIANISTGLGTLRNFEKYKACRFVESQRQTVFVVSSTGPSFICWEWLLWGNIKKKKVDIHLRYIKTSALYGARTFLVVPMRSLFRRLRQKIVTHFVAKLTGRRRNCRHEDFVLVTNSRVTSPSMCGNGGDMCLVENTKGEQTKGEQVESPYAVVWERQFNYDKYLIREQISPTDSQLESTVEMKNLRAEKQNEINSRSLEPLRRSCGIVPGRGSSEIHRAVLLPQSPEFSESSRMLLNTTRSSSRHHESRLLNDDMQTTRSQPSGAWQVLHPTDAVARPTIELAYDLLQSCKSTMVVPDSKVLQVVGSASILDLHGAEYVLRKEFLAPDLLEDVEFTKSILIFLEFHVVALVMNLTEFHYIMFPIASHGFPWGTLIALAISVIRCINSIFNHAFDKEMIDGILEDE